MAELDENVTETEHTATAEDPLLTGSSLTFAGRNAVGTCALVPLSSDSPPAEPDVEQSLVSSPSPTGRGPEASEVDDCIASESTRLRAAQTSHPAQVISRAKDSCASSEDEAGTAQRYYRNGEVPEMEHAANPQQHKATLDMLDADVREEATVNEELVSQLLGRLAIMRRCSERCLGAAQAFASAEATYALGLTTASNIPLTSITDGGAIQDVLAAFRELPQAVSSVHAEVGDGLMSVCKRAQLVVVHLRRECNVVAAACSQGAIAIDNARRQLRVASAIHQEACRTVELTQQSRARQHGRTISRGFSGGASSDRSAASAATPAEVDPWATQARLVAQLTTLAAAQDSHRQTIAAAAGRLKELEVRRVTAIKDVVSTFVSSYPPALLPEGAATETVVALLDKIDPDSGAVPVESAADAAQSSSRELATRQAATLVAMRTQLMSSPEIIRQGQLDLQLSSKGEWMMYQCVLTRCCFLYWFADVEDLQKFDGVRLSCCQFVAGTNAEFHIIEQSSASSASLPALDWLLAAIGRPRNRHLTLHASDVNESCEWAIAIRELMAATSKRR